MADELVPLLESGLVARCTPTDLEAKGVTWSAVAGAEKNAAGNAHGYDGHMAEEVWTAEKLER